MFSAVGSCAQVAPGSPASRRYTFVLRRQDINKAGCHLPPLSLFARARGLLLSSAGATEDVHDAVVAFVATVLPRVTPGLEHRNLSAPRSGPRGRIGRRELVDDPVVAHAREAFDHVQGGAGSLEGGLLVEVRRLDNQGVTLPPAARVAGPLADPFGEMRPFVRGNDPRQAGGQLAEHNDIAWRLEN